MWPHTRMHALNNSGLPFVLRYEPLVSDVGRIWGAWHPGDRGTVVADTCPIEAPRGATTYDVSYILTYNRLHLRNVRKAFTDDYSDATMAAFTCLLGATQDDPNDPLRCFSAVSNTMNYLLDRVITTSDPNYRVYYHTGACHAERTSDGNDPPNCDYDRMVQHGVRLRDWVKGWIDDRPDWQNVR